MKLLELTVKNFRAIGSGIDDKGVTIRFGANNLITLIGVNNAGKSALLAAYDYFKRDIPAKDDDFHGKLDRPIEISVKLKIESSSEKENTEIKYFAYIDESTGDNILKVRKIWETTTIPKIDGWYQPNKAWLAPKNNTEKFNERILLPLPQPIPVEGMNNPDDIIKKLQAVVKNAVIEHLKQTQYYSDLKETINNAFNKIQSLVDIDPYIIETKKRINQTINPVFPQISLSIENMGGDFGNLLNIIEKQTQVFAIEQGKPNVSLEYQGHGVRRLFILSAYKNLSKQFALIDSSKRKKPTDFNLEEEKKEEVLPKTKILLVEEPELFLHPNAIRLIQNLLYDLAESTEYQVLCATHSPIMVDLSREHSSLVRVVPDENLGTLAYQVETNLFKPGERQWLRMIREFDSYVCEAFLANKVLLVEGHTELIAVRTILEKLKKDNNVDTDLLVVNCNGKTTIPLFQKILRKFHISYFVFHDMDYRFTDKGKRTNVWQTNIDIWKEIELARENGVSARRFVFKPEFESDNGYDPPSGGKPHLAYMQIQHWIQTWDKETVQNKPVIKYIKVILDLEHLDEQFDIAWLNQQPTGSVPTEFLDELEQSDFFGIVQE